MSDRTIALADCVERGLYRLHSRNLVLGVYVGDGLFVGIREKFGSRYLDTELHPERGGTARPIDRVSIDAPAGIPLLGGWGSSKVLFDFLVVPDALAAHRDAEEFYNSTEMSWGAEGLARLHGQEN